MFISLEELAAALENGLHAYCDRIPPCGLEGCEYCSLDYAKELMRFIAENKEKD